MALKTAPSPPDTPDLSARAAEAAAYLKTLGHEGRLMILCNLVEGEKSVSELVALLELRQAVVSQMLSRLRYEGLVTTRRDGRAVYYGLADDKTTQVITLLHQLFCE